MNHEVHKGHKARGLHADRVDTGAVRGSEALNVRSPLSQARSAGCGVVVLVMLAHGAGPAAQTTFSSRVEAVRVDVLVTDRGHPLTDLTAASFEVLDNGVPQQVDFASFEQIPLNVV